eukprot:314816_1
MAQSFIFLLIFICLSNSKNVLMLFCDDSGREISGAYSNIYPPAKQAISPNINNLAKHSMVFNYGYTSVSSCSPSRSALLTGLPVHQNGMYGLANGFHHFQSFDAYGGAKPPTIGKLLSANGYFTGLIGKYHVEPMEIYSFDYLIAAETGFDANQAGRNITFMKQYMIDFLDNKVPKNGNKSWYLEIAFFDTHRGCGGAQGPFCNNWGNGSTNMGIIPDWKPIEYNPAELILPFWIPDNPQSRGDYAAYLTSFSRTDQGVGLFINVLQERDLLKNTLIIFSSDNGIPFTSSKTNLYEQGQIEPFMISLPEMWHNGFNGPLFTDYIAGNTDIFPTILDWLNLTYPNYILNGANVFLTGESLLEVVQNNITKNERKSNVYGSHMFHE